MASVRESSLEAWSVNELESKKDFSLVPWLGCECSVWMLGQKMEPEMGQVSALMLAVDWENLKDEETVRLMVFEWDERASVSAKMRDDE